MRKLLAAAIFPIACAIGFGAPANATTHELNYSPQYGDQITFDYHFSGDWSASMIFDFTIQRVYDCGPDVFVGFCTADIPYGAVYCNLSDMPCELDIAETTLGYMNSRVSHTSDHLVLTVDYKFKDYYHCPSPGTGTFELCADYVYRKSFGLSYDTDADYTLTVTRSTAPEPNAWALLIIGFAACGGALRHRRARFAA